MAEWLVEEGIAEHRAAQWRGGNIVAARVQWPGELAAGTVAQAVLASRHAGSARGTALFPDGTQALVSGLPREASEGASLSLEIMRAPVAERGRLKLAQARPTAAAACTAPTLAQKLCAEGHEVLVVRRFAGSEWEALMAEAFDARVPFAGGSLDLALTPAMTLIDIDGTLPPAALALAAVPAIAAALRRFAIGGSVGIDFPTPGAKAERRAVDAALAQALADWPHERTAMNGFGLVQIVARLTGPSLLQRCRFHGAAAAARLLLRRGEAVEAPGAVLLSFHPALAPHLTQDRLAELARRTGRPIRTQTDAGLASESGFAQAIAP